MKSFRITILALAFAALCSCTGKAVIDCNIAGSPDTEISVRKISASSYSVIDTVKTDSSGSFTYKVKAAQDNPQFVYFFRGETRIAGLLVQAGEKIKVSADTLGHFEVEGSPESSKLRELDNKFASCAGKLVRLYDENKTEEMSKVYVDYYRECVKYVMTNSGSLTVIPVLFQQLTPIAPVFSQDTDAIIFRAVCDSLEAVYPKSEYLTLLKNETRRRENILELNGRLSNTIPSNFPSLSLPDLNGKKVCLDSLDAKVILVHFWTSADAAQKMINIEDLLPLYKDFHPKGFEIYSVCIDPDKAGWASVVKSQNLPWVNVNDGLGTSSSALALYNVGNLPSSYIIASGSLTQAFSGSSADLRREIASLLR